MAAWRRRAAGPGSTFRRFQERYMATKKRIGILTSGGDCAGLNAVIRAVAYRAIDGYGWQVVGIRNGTAGLLARPVEYEDRKSGVSGKGGSVRVDLGGRRIMKKKRKK